MKKIMYLLLIGIIFMGLMSKVTAEEIMPLEEFSNKFNESEVVKQFNTLFEKTISSKINEEEQTFDIYSGEEKTFSLKYNPDKTYLEFDHQNIEITNDDLTNEFINTLYISIVVQATFESFGFPNKTLNEDLEDELDTLDFDTYGLQLKTQFYEFEEENQYGHSTVSGSYIKYFKLSLDKEKIKNLIDTYGIDNENQDPNKEIINSIKPTLRADNITEKSVNLYPHLNYTNTNPDYSVKCYIYRSNSANGEYKRISDLAINCLDENISVIDDNLTPNTTYYYKTQVVDGILFSDAIEVKTLASKDKQKEEKDELENPSTGAELPFVVLGTMLIIGIFLIKIKNPIKKI